MSQPDLVKVKGVWQAAGYGACLELRPARGGGPLELAVTPFAPDHEYFMTVRTSEDAHALAELLIAVGVMGPAQTAGLIGALQHACIALPLEGEL
jgi:hypothetical protein